MLHCVYYYGIIFIDNSYITRLGIYIYEVYSNLIAILRYICCIYLVARNYVNNPI